MKSLAECLPMFFARFGGDTPDMQRLACMLEVSSEELRLLWDDRRYGYQRFSIRKRSGGRRRIAAPSDRLKRLQRRLLHTYLGAQPVHDAATAFRPGGSIATHARRHLGQAIVLTVDLVDFFEATSAQRVRRWFRDGGWDHETTRILTRMCVYRGGLPQGAPTSPALSNLVNRKLDEQLHELAAWHGARYSRYCDDLAFSWANNSMPPTFHHQVEDRLGQFGYRVQPEKGWRLQRSADRPEITGVILDGRKLRLPERILRRWRELRRGWRISDARRQQLAGYRGLIKMLTGRRRWR